jgi:hypothetical protein
VHVEGVWVRPGYPCEQLPCPRHVARSIVEVAQRIPLPKVPLGRIAERSCCSRAQQRDRAGQISGVSERARAHDPCLGQDLRPRRGPPQFVPQLADPGGPAQSPHAVHQHRNQVLFAGGCLVPLEVPRRISPAAKTVRGQARHHVKNGDPWGPVENLLREAQGLSKPLGLVRGDCSLCPADQLRTLSARGGASRFGDLLGDLRRKRDRCGWGAGGAWVVHHLEALSVCIGPDPAIRRGRRHAWAAHHPRGRAELPGDDLAGPSSGHPAPATCRAWQGARPGVGGVPCGPGSAARQRARPSRSRLGAVTTAPARAPRSTDTGRGLVLSTGSHGTSASAGGPRPTNSVGARAIRSHAREPRGPAPGGWPSAPGRGGVTTG